MTSELASRIDALERITNLFKLERYAYVAICVISSLALIGCALYLIKTGNIGYALGLFGASGGIAASVGLLLSMWNRAISVILSAK